MRLLLRAVTRALPSRNNHPQDGRAAEQIPLNTIVATDMSHGRRYSHPPAFFSFKSSYRREAGAREKIPVSYCVKGMFEMEAYRQVLDFDSECEFCHKPLILLTNGDPTQPTFHMCMCQSSLPHIIQDGVGSIPSFARSVVHPIPSAVEVCLNCSLPLVDGVCYPCFAPRVEDFEPIT